MLSIEKSLMPKGYAIRGGNVEVTIIRCKFVYNRHRAYEMYKLIDLGKIDCLVNFLCMQKKLIRNPKIVFSDILISTYIGSTLQIKQGI